MSQPERIFIGWDKPLARGVAEQLLAGRKNGLVDLGSHIVIVPSSFAGRLLQEQLAAQCSGGLLLPRIVTPHHFLNWGEDGDGEIEERGDIRVANADAMLVAWMGVLTGTFDRAKYPVLFTAGQRGPFNTQDAADFAHDLMALRDQLGAAKNGMTFADMAQADGEIGHALDEHSQRKRWEALAELEELYLARLGKLRLADHNDHRVQLALGPDDPKGIDTIWLACVVDPQPLLLTALERRCERINVCVTIAADKNDAAAFDEWGRPLAAAWTAPGKSVWRNFRETVHVVRNPDDGLEKLSKLVRQFHADAFGAITTKGRLAVVPCDRDQYPLEIAHTLHALQGSEQTTIETANPLGKKHREHGMHHAMAALLDLIDNPTFANARRVLILPNLASKLIKAAGGAGEKRPRAFHELQRALDALSGMMPPQDIMDAKQMADGLDTSEGIEAHQLRANLKAKQAAGILADIQQAIADWLKGNKVDALELGKTLLELCQQEINPVAERDAWNYAKDVSEAIEASLEAICACAPESTGLSRTDIVRLALRSASAKSFRGDMDREAVNLPGWMEATWEPVPHLVIFGLTDDTVPGTSHAHAFLPGGLRQKLGLPTTDHALGNAAYSLELMRRLRSGTNAKGQPLGRVDVIVPRLSLEGDGLRPSRILMLAAETEDDTLLGEDGRLRHLLQDNVVPNAEPAWEIPKGMRLDPTLVIENIPANTPEGAMPPPNWRLSRIRSSISATDFKLYLEDPANFWLKKALGLSESSHDEMEMGAGDFGNLIHAALEQFGNSPTDKDLEDEADIEAALGKHLDAHCARRYGNKPPPLLLLQVEIARKRLEWFAKTQAKLRKDGWRIHEVEGRLPPLKLAEGFTLGGRYDRLDFNEKTGTWRIYDYKTFAKLKGPKSTHYADKGVAGEKGHIGYFTLTVESKEKPMLWKDLQLVAYYWAVFDGHEKAKGQPIEAGYLCIPANETDAHVQIFAPIEGMMDKGKKCMEDIASKLKSGDAGAFKAAEKDPRYPLLQGMLGRPKEAYLVTENLGKARTAASR